MYHMTDNKQTVHFEIEYFQGVTCIGCVMIEDLAIDVEFTNDEITKMRQLVSQLDDALYSDGLMPVLKDVAPELYECIDLAACSAIFNFLVEDGIRQGYIDADDDSPKDQVTMEDNPEYICNIPVDFLP